MSSVEDNARSAIENLIKELEKERSVSMKYATLNEELISKLTANEEEKAGLIKDNERLLKENEELKEQIQEMKLRSHQETMTVDSQPQSPKDATVEAADIAVAKTVETSTDDSEVKEDITLAVATKDTKPIDSIPMDERKRFFVKILMIIRLTFRGYFGLKYDRRWGHFVDRYMCKQIHHYADWLEYPDGNHMLAGKNSRAVGVAISSDGCYLFIGYENKCIIKWNLLTLEPMNQWDAHEDMVTCLNYHRGLLISGSRDKMVKVWNGYTCDLIHTLEGHTGGITSINLNRSGSQIISSSNDNSMRVWNLKTGECLREIKVHSDAVRSAYFMGNVIISTSFDESIKITDPSNGKELRKITDGITKMVYDMSINSNRSMVACLCQSIIIYTWPEMKMFRTIDADPMCGRFHPINPDILAVHIYKSNAVTIYNVKTGDLIRVLKGHTKTIHGIHFTPDGTRIVSTSEDQTSRICNVSEF